VRPIAAGGGRYDPYLVLDQGIDADRDNDVDPGDEQILAEGVETLQVSYAFADVIEDAVDSTLAPVGATPGTDVTLVAGRIAAGSSDSANTTAGRITRTDFAGPDPSAIPILEVYSRSSFFPYTYGPPLPAERKTNHQGNVRSVRIAVVARSSTPDPDMGGKPALTGAATFTVLNLNAIPAWISGGATQGLDGFERIRFDTTVSLPNMTNRRMLDQ
jgi:type IV pilus assembly protein PilW